jgi:pimeloyl-ACP methyl ester carboxylesterase
VPSPADADGAGVDVAALEHAWVGAPRGPGVPEVVFLHEGLGSVAMWKAFPHAFCAEHGFAGFVYSRRGYGRSPPRPPGERWSPRFLHVQAWDVLPRLLAHHAIERPFLFGHSDGGSIALLHAARHPVAGAVVLAPHLFVEDVSVASIRGAKAAYEQGDLKRGLAKYHDDPDSAFFGWNDVWLSDAFRAWNLEADLAAIDAPVLAMQGVDDAYGTMAQVRRLAALLTGKVRLIEIPACGHSPHRDRPALVAREAGSFVRETVVSRDPP